MSVTVDLIGLDRTLRKIAYATKSGGVKATLAGAAVVKEHLKNRTPYDEDSPRNRQKDAQTGELHEFKHMRDDIVISKPNDVGTVTVGYGKATAWRSRFPNDGTIHQEGQHFAERTVSESRGEVVKVMQRIIDLESKRI